MSCKERVLLARLVAGIRSNDVRKSLLCMQDLTLEKAVQHIQVDEATSIQATQFSTQVKKAGASTYKQGKGNKTSYKQSPPHSETRDETPRRCKFCMTFHTFRKELCPAKDSFCKVCHNRGHWANSLMCPSTSKPSAGRSSEESKPDSGLIQSKSSSNPSLKSISALGESQISATVSVKSINVSPIPSVGSHCHVDFLIGNNNWIQSCMIDPGANINCVGYDWITHFETSEWNYNLECGPVKTAGGYKLEAEARVLLKISWPPQHPVLSANQWFYIVHGEDGVVLGTPACLTLGAIDEQWPLSTLKERAQFSSSTVKTAHADSVHAPAECSLPNCSVSEVHTKEHPLSEDELLSQLNWIHHSATKVCSQVHVLQASSVQPVVSNDDETSVSSLLQEYKDVFDETVLPVMSGEPFKINLKPDATPCAQLKARKIPIPYLDQLKKQLNEMEQLGVISACLRAKSLVSPDRNRPKEGHR